MLDERKAAILRAVVEEYIETAQPVGLGPRRAAPGVDVSSATVRNEMAALEQEGYLRQPHTSAGRVPTDKGYRFFVDHLRQPGRLDAAGRPSRCATFFARAHGELEQMLHDTSRLLSDLTDLRRRSSSARRRRDGDGPLGPARRPRRRGRAAGGRAVSDGAVEKHTIELADGRRRRAAGGRDRPPRRPPGRQPAPRAVAASPATGDAATDALVGAGRRPPWPAPPTPTTRARLRRRHGPHGRRPSTPSRPCARCSASSSSSSSSSSLLRDVLDRGLHVAIGTETGMAPLAECSLVVAPYDVEGEPAGTIGVLGPTRMNYPQALAAVAVVSQRLGRPLTEG